jgi:small subunit ribosomal protein S6
MTPCSNIDSDFRAERRFSLRRYETILIADVNLSSDELNGLIERYKTIITDLKGIIAKIEEWGKRKLAYEIKKQSRGSYILIDFAGKSEIVTELERNLKIDDKILKFLTIKKSDSVDIQDIEKEINAAKKDEKVVEPSPPPGEIIIETNNIKKNILSESPDQGKVEKSVEPEALQQENDVKGDK